MLEGWDNKDLLGEGCKGLWEEDCEGLLGEGCKGLREENCKGLLGEGCNKGLLREGWKDKRLIEEGFEKRE